MTIEFITFILLFVIMWIALVFEAINHRHANFMFRFVVMMTLITIAIKLTIIVDKLIIIVDLLK